MKLFSKIASVLPKSGVLFKGLEAAVFLLIIAIFAKFGYQIFFSGDFSTDREARNAAYQFLESVDRHWKGALIILLPLFYRIIIKTLERLEKLPGGTELRKPLEKNAEEISIPFERNINR